MAWQGVMSDRNKPWCCLCGVIIDPFEAAPHSDVAAQPAEYISWLGEIRGIRTEWTTADPFVTGVGFIDHHNVVHAYREENRRYDGGPMPTHPVFFDTDSWCYLVHDVCWELLRDRADPSRTLHPNFIARQLFPLLYNTPINYRCFLVPAPRGRAADVRDEVNIGFQEDDHFGGASRFHAGITQNIGYFTLVNASEGWYYLTGDPREPLQEDEDCLWEAIEAVSYPYFPHSHERATEERLLPERCYYNPEDSSNQGTDPAEEDPFVRLPNELVTLILGQLPSRDLVNFRLASRYVADIAAPRSLGPEFWASRFEPDWEMGFVFAGPACAQMPSPRSPDWRQLYIKSRATLNCADLFPGFRNRQRIWGALQHVAEALRLRLANASSADYEAHLTHQGGLDKLLTREALQAQAQARYLDRSKDISLPSSLSLGGLAMADAECHPIRMLQDKVEARECDKDEDDESTATMECIRFIDRCGLYMAHGCRVLGVEKLCLPGLQTHSSSDATITTRLDISTVYYNGWMHICGFRVSQCGGDRANGGGSCMGGPDDARWTEVSRAGFISPWRRKGVIMYQGDKLEMLEVAMSTSGLQGMRFHIRGTERPEQLRIETVGTMAIASNTDIGIGRLVPDKKKAGWAGFVVGIDACKIVFLSLLERLDDNSTNKTNGASSLPTAPTATANSPQTTVPRPLKLPIVQLWSPSEPFPLPNMAESEHPEFPLSLNMDFGGSDDKKGSLLSSLVRVVVYMGSFPDVFTGMKFVYADGSDKEFGRRFYSSDAATEIASVEQSFAIDGPGGEYLIGCTTSHKGTVQDAVETIELSTNWGRSADFRLHFKEGGDASSDGNKIHVHLAPEEGKALTRFFAKLKSPGSHFRDFSVESHEVASLGLAPIDASKLKSDSTSHAVPITADVLASAHEMLGYTGGFTFSAAQLAGVRRIRVSVGRPGSLSSTNRSENHVSGLRLEYDGEAVILGQWIQESEESPLELSGAGARIVEMTTYHSYTNQVKRVKFGPLTRLVLRTSSGEEKTFPKCEGEPAPLVGDVCLKHRENPYEQLGAIVWGCNFEWDHVRALYQAKPSPSKSSRIPTTAVQPDPTTLQSSLVYRPEIHQRIGGIGNLASDSSAIDSSWVVREQAFLKDQVTADDGSKQDDFATAIEVSYRDDRHGEPSSLTIEYASGASTTIGARNPKREPQRYELSPGENVTRMDIGLLRGNRISFIRFMTDKHRNLHFHDKDSIPDLVNIRISYPLRPSFPDYGAGSGSRPLASRPAGREERETRVPKPARKRTTHEWDPVFTSPAAEAYQAQQRERERKRTLEEDGIARLGDEIAVKEEAFPEEGAEFVGFWATPRRRDRSLRFGMFGPIFTRKAAEKPKTGGGLWGQ